MAAYEEVLAKIEICKRTEDSDQGWWKKGVLNERVDTAATRTVDDYSSTEALSGGTWDWTDYGTGGDKREENHRLKGLAVHLRRS